MNQSLLDILQCPITSDRLRYATEDELARLRERSNGGGLQNRSGEKPTGKIENALINESNEWVYVICNGIPTMLADEAIPFDSLEKHP